MVTIWSEPSKQNVPCIVQRVQSNLWPNGALLSPGAFGVDLVLWDFCRCFQQKKKGLKYFDPAPLSGSYGCILWNWPELQRLLLQKRSHSSLITLARCPVAAQLRSRSTNLIAQFKYFFPPPLLAKSRNIWYVWKSQESCSYRKLGCTWCCSTLRTRISI